MNSGIDNKLNSKSDDNTNDLDGLVDEYLDDERQRKPRGNKLKKMKKVLDNR